MTEAQFAFFIVVFEVLITDGIWCLYGAIPNVPSIINFETKNDTLIDEQITVSVATTIQIAGETIVLERRADFRLFENDLKKIAETTSVNLNQSCILFDAIVNELFPREYLPCFLWDRAFTCLRKKNLYIDKYFEQEDIKKVLSYASTLFNKIYFRKGQYKIVYEHELKLKRIDCDIFDECLSEEDNLFLFIAVAVAICRVMRKKHQNLCFPIMIDDIISHLSEERAKILLDYLFALSGPQILFLYHNKDNELLDQIIDASQTVGFRYGLEPNMDWSSTSIKPISDEVELE